MSPATSRPGRGARESSTDAAMPPRAGHLCLALVIFKRVGDGRPLPRPRTTPRDWAALPPRQVRLDELITTKDTLQLAALLDEDSTFFGDPLRARGRVARRALPGGRAAPSPPCGPPPAPSPSRPRPHHGRLTPMGRQLTTAVTMFVLVGILVVGGILGWRSLFAELPGTATAGGETSASAPPSRSGGPAGPRRPGRGERLQRRHHLRTRRRDAGPAPQARLPAGRGQQRTSDRRRRRVQVWSTIEDDAEARLVALQFGKTVKVTYSDVDLGPGSTYSSATTSPGCPRPRPRCGSRPPSSAASPRPPTPDPTARGVTVTPRGLTTDGVDGSRLTSQPGTGLSCRTTTA